jgi:hypothetical protein
MHVDDAASSNCQALFWGNTRGRLRTDIFKHLQALNKPDWSLESTGQGLTLVHLSTFQLNLSRF